MDPRFFFEGELRAGEILELPEDAARHARVLRLREANGVVLFNGRGGEFHGIAVSISRSEVQVKITSWKNVERESPLDVTLAQGISSGEKMDYTVQKAVELGVAAVRPLLCEKSVVRLDGKRAAARVAHWRRVAIAACEQCGRNRIPAILEPVTVGEFDAGAKSLHLLLAIQGGKKIRDVEIRPDQSIVLAAGPEAGFSAAETKALLQDGFAPVTLGPRVLRTDTAALAALAALNALRGDS
jgi:16S rRNA (uracil1498-N3)-methyltransferase